LGNEGVYQVLRGVSVS
jgi:hypothetical protein